MRNYQGSRINGKFGQENCLSSVYRCELVSRMTEWPIKTSLRDYSNFSAPREHISGRGGEKKSFEGFEISHQRKTRWSRGLKGKKESVREWEDLRET